MPAVLPTDSAFSENGSDEDSAACYIWALHTLAQHYAEIGDSAKALSTIEKVSLLLLLGRSDEDEGRKRSNDVIITLLIIIVQVGGNGGHMPID